MRTALVTMTGDCAGFLLCLVMNGTDLRLELLPLSLLPWSKALLLPLLERDTTTFMIFGPRRGCVTDGVAGDDVDDADDDSGKEDDDESAGSSGRLSFRRPSGVIEVTSFPT